jgi:hypothetical protein
MHTDTSPHVLTLEEVSIYLRLSPEAVQQQAIAGKIPGQEIDGDWRFLRQAVDDWLRCRNQKSRDILLSQAGIFAGDEALVEIQAEIDRQRRPATLEAES